MIIRLNKFIAHSGLMSRRKAEEAILSGRIKINGETVHELGISVDTDCDIVVVDGEKISIPNESHTYLLLNKPTGYVSTASDEHNRPTVLDLIDENELKSKRLYPIGRLDINTSGLLILTDDGDLTYQITHPKHNVNKTYIAVLKGIPSPHDLERFRSGLKIEDYTTSPSEIEIIHLRTNACTVKVTIHEGKNRQVRKMLATIGTSAKSLQRVSIGKIPLGDLPISKYRNLTENEVSYLKSL